VFKTESNAVGIDIKYDDETQLFKIGSDDYETVESLNSFKGEARYKRAVSVLNHMGETSTQLNWYNFAQFANMYCPNNAADPQCAQITAFVNDYKKNQKGESVDKNSPVVGREIRVSIEQGEKQANNATSTRFKNSLGSSGAPVAAASGAAASGASGAAASGAAASEDVRRVSPNDQIRLERMIGVQGQIKLHFGKTEYILSLSRPIIIQIPPNPRSKQNPVTQLIFLATEVTKQIEGTVPEITVEFVLKNDDMARCAMQMYYTECQMNGSRDEFNNEKPSIKKYIMLSGFFKQNIIGIGSDIIPLMDKLERFAANECASQSLEDKMGSISVGSESAPPPGGGGKTRRKHRR
jgi:hypothetical protein